MGNIERIVSIPQLWGALLAAFLAILGVRITYPMANTILGLFDDGIMKAVAIFVMWFIYFTVTWVFTWLILFRKDEGGEARG